MNAFTVFAVLAAIAACASAVPLQGSVDFLDGDSNDRIVGGVVAQITNFPWIVSVQLGAGAGRHICGGTIISDNRILSAAHCTEQPGHLYSVRAGSNAHASGGQVARASRVVNHPNYVPRSNPPNFDICVIHLATRLNLALPGVSIIRMPAQGAGVAVGAYAQVAGWGAQAQGSQVSSPVLRSVGVPIVSNAQCNAMKGGRVTSNMLCAGFTQGGRDACQGDSGGPLTLNGLVIGVVSWGIGCARPNSPGVYASVAFFRNWVDAN